MKTLTSRSMAIAILLPVFFIAQVALSQKNPAGKTIYQVIEKDSLTGMYKVKSAAHQVFTGRVERKEPVQSRLEKAVSIRKRIDSQLNEMEKFFHAQQQARAEQKQRQQQKQTAQTPKLKKIKLFGKETAFYEGPKVVQKNNAPLRKAMVTSNVLINGKQNDTIQFGGPFELTFSFAPNAISALINITIDINNNGIKDVDDIPLVTNGLIIDNGDEDLDPAVGTYRMNNTNEVYSGIISTVIYEVDNYETVTSAALTVIDRPGPKVLVGSVTPVFHNTVVLIYSVSLNHFWIRIVTPDSSGKIVIHLDTLVISELYVDILDFGSTPAGYLPPSSQELVVMDDTTYFALTYIPATEFIEGYVRDQHGDPTQHATIRGYNYSSGSGSISTTSESDSTGHYRLGVRSGSVEVSVIPPSTTDEYMEYFLDYRDIFITANQTINQDFLLIRANETISGFVNYNSAGVGGVPISGDCDTLENSTITGADGGYSLKVWKPLSGYLPYTIYCNVGDYGYYVDTTYQYNILPGASNVNFTILKVNGGVEGYVTDARTGEPIKNADLDFSGPNYRYVTTNDTGYFRISLRDGVYSLSVYAEYYETVYGDTVVIFGSIVSKNITMNRTGSFSGTITDESGKPLNNAYVYARDSLGSYMGYGYVDDVGKYVVDGLQTMRYKAVAQANGYVFQWYDKKSSIDSATMFNVINGYDTPNINFVLSRGGSISGVVKDKNGTGLQNSNVTVFDTSLSSVSSARTDASGAYTAPGLNTGNYYVSASSDYHIEQWYNGANSYANATKVAVVVNQNTPDINFTLLTGGIITGKVTNKSGTPMYDANVYVYDSLYNYVRYDYTDNAGTYEIRKLPAGKKLYIRASNYQYGERWYDNALMFETATPIILDVDERRDNINFVLPANGKISGTVKNKAGDVIPNAYIYAMKENGSTYYGNTNTFGNYIIENTPPGKYIVEAGHTDYFTQWYNQKSTQTLADTIIVEEETTTSNIDFTLTAGGKITGIVKNTFGDAIDGASIYVSQLNGNYYYGYSNISGIYTISPVIPGVYTVMASYYENRDQWYNHRSSILQADSVLVEEGITTSDINFDLLPQDLDSIVVKISVADLPDSVKFNQSFVSDNYIEYWWGTRFELSSDVSDDFETEIALTHAKMTGESEFNADPVSTSQHSLIRWYGNNGYTQRTNVRIWRNPTDKNSLYLSVPLSWVEIENIGNLTQFYAKTGYSSQGAGFITDKTANGTGPTTVTDAQGDVAYGLVDIISAGWRKNTTFVETSNEIPSTFSLHQNYPNPFNPATVIHFDVPVSSNVKLVVFDMLGRQVAVVVNEEKPAGMYNATWDASAFPSGVYFYRLTARQKDGGGNGNFVETKKMILLR